MEDFRNLCRKYAAHEYIVVEREVNRGETTLVIYAPGKSKGDVYRFALESLGKGLICKRDGSLWSYRIMP